MQLATFRVHEGRLRAFKDSIERAVAFAEAHGPQLLVEVYLDEQAMRAYSCQIQPNPDAMLAHWELADAHIRAVMEHCTLERLDVYGRPSDAVLARLRALPGRGITLAVTPGFVGFGRFRSD